MAIPILAMAKGKTKELAENRIVCLNSRTTYVDLGHIPNYVPRWVMRLYFEERVDKTPAKGKCIYNFSAWLRLIILSWISH